MELAGKVVSWDEHVKRGSSKWSAMLDVWKGEDWVARKRVANYRNDRGATVLDARRHIGHVALRWHTGVENAKVHLKDEIGKNSSKEAKAKCGGA